MALDYRNLDPRVRVLMQAEVDLDVERGTLYESAVLTVTGLQRWPDLLAHSIAHGDDSTLADLVCRYLRPTDRHGHRTPHNANMRLAEGEFNRFYIRAMCLAALEDGVGLKVYRAKRVRQARPASEAWIGCNIPAAELLEDLRKLPGQQTVWGVPGGCNSGISVEFAATA